MLTPEYLQGAPEEIEMLFRKLEQDIIADICRRIAKAGYLTDTAQHQTMRLKELGAGTEYIKQKIKDYSGMAEEAVDWLFFDAAQFSSDFYADVYSKAKKPFVPFERNAFFQQVVDAAVNQTKGELVNLTQSIGFSYIGGNGFRQFYPVAKAYHDTLDYAATQIASGMTDYQTAIRNATRRLTDSGLQYIDYESGVKTSADAAARRAVLTGLSQMTGKIAERNAAELDTDIVEVSAHAGARPDHAEWQGRWYSFSGKSKEYKPLVDVTGYGTVSGLKGANCRHDFYPVISGISEPSYTEEELKNIDPPPFVYKKHKYTAYEATQKQRAMERAIRKTKREILAAESTGDKDVFTAKSVLLRRQKEEYSKFSDAAGLLPQNERYQVDGFGRSTASKAAWAAKKAAQAKKNGGAAPSGTAAPSGQAVTVNVSGRSNGGTGKVYRDEKITIHTPRIISDFKANTKVIDSKEYYSKYRGVTTHKISIFDRKVADYAKNCISVNDGKATERVYLLLASTGGKRDMIELSDYGGTFTYDFSGYKPNSLILVHNHPNNAPFSFDDFVSANNNPEIKTIIAAGHDGTVYKLSCGDGRRLDLSDKNVYNDYENRWDRDYSIEQGSLMSVTNLAKKLGWSFEYE